MSAEINEVGGMLVALLFGVIGYIIGRLSDKRS